ncbi:MAG TPA: hypothetical protein GXZ56_04810 [Bacteroidales bacterium]|jgi:hypothetical protein|nr:hypothetical protein [Bacteroidales bacterium]
MTERIILEVDTTTFDTNCLISATLIAGSVNAQALDKDFRSGTLAFSRETFTELVEVL